jgi:hypothetical protein
MDPESLWLDDWGFLKEGAKIYQMTLCHQTHFQEAGGFEEDRMENDQLTVDLIKSIDLQFNEPAFEKNILEDPVLDSPAIEPEASFFWKSPPPGLEVYPVMPPDPPPGPYSDKQDVRPVGQEGEQKSDAAQFHGKQSSLSLFHLILLKHLREELSFIQSNLTNCT